MPKWSTLLKLAKAGLSKATIGIALIYLVYYMRLGGFKTAPLEITLAGTLLLLLSAALTVVLCPDLISEHETPFTYESYVESKITGGFVTAIHYASCLEDVNPSSSEARRAGYKFDSDFSYTIQDLQSSLGGDKQLATFVAKVKHDRENRSKTKVRNSIFVIGMVGVVLMYTKPIKMLINIYCA